MLRGISALAFVLVGATVALGQPVSELEVEAPERLTLGDPASASVEISARAPQGRPLRFFANVGTFDEPEVRDGRTIAMYHPPSARFPQVAILGVATVDFEVVDWARIALEGTPTVRFSFEANSRVIVRIGEREFGPVNTDAGGDGEVELVVPPGVLEAEATGTDRLGNTRTQSIPLNPPPFDRELWTCLPGGAGALLIAVDDSGQPRESVADLRFESDGGVLTPGLTAPGVFEVRHEVPSSDIPRQEVELSVARGDEVQERCTSTVQRVGPDRVEITLSAPSVSRPGEEVAVAVDLFYPEDVHRLAVVPSLVADRGRIGPVEPTSATHGGLRFEATWLAPEDFGSGPEATLRATVGDVAESTTLLLDSPRSPFGVGVFAGVLANFGRILAPQAGATLRYAIPLGRHDALTAGVLGGFWRGTDSQLDQEGVETVDLEFTAAPILARLGYRRSLGDAIDLLATVDVGALIAHYRLGAPSSGTSARTQVTWVIGASAGVAVRLGPGSLDIELGYRYAPVSGGVQGNGAGLHGVLGYTLEVPIQ